jgi:alanyl-tRNA synthetase
MITRKELIEKYIDFFKAKGHKQIQNAPLVPENDPTVLFTTAGMHPIVPFLLGQSHPLGKRLCNVQKCIRTQDIDEVGDTYHHTFFEMLGNWSLGDYFKKEVIEWSFEFLTKVLKIQKEKLAVSVFAGDKDAPKDEESANIWISLGIPKERIAFLPKKENWWGPAGKTGPCGPDTEMFYWKNNSKPSPKKFNPEDNNWVEIWNDVLMQYNKDKRLILVDGMYCLYDENFNLNKKLLDLINSFNSHNILVTNKFREKGYRLVKDTNWKAFSLEEKGIKKDDPEYFNSLLKIFNLVPEEVMYFDHDKKSVETAEKLGILSKQYIDIKSIKKFIEDNLYAIFPAKQKNVDTGMGVERTSTILNGLEDDYLGDTFKQIIESIEKISRKKYGQDETQTRAMRIITDHIKASAFILADGVIPSNTEQGYVLRRLIRRAVRYGREIGIRKFTKEVAKPVFSIYDDYENLQKNKKQILEELEKEEERFNVTIEKGVTRFKRHSEKKEELSGKEAFLLYQSFGFPIEMIIEECARNKIVFNIKEFEKEFEKHKELSRTASVGRFKSGLADHSEETTKLHTTAHLLLSALRKVLNDNNIIQKGSNITPERLRLDFSFPRKLTEEEVKGVEKLVNEQIQKKCDVIREEMSPSEAKKKGALGIFDEKYGEKVSVYTVGDFSKEICAGPHVENLCELGKFKILKEESSSSGVRRIKATLE